MKARLFLLGMTIAFCCSYCTKDEPATPYSDQTQLRLAEQAYVPAESPEPAVEILFLGSLPEGEQPYNATEAHPTGFSCNYAPCEKALPHWQKHFAKEAARTCETQYACIACCENNKVLFAKLVADPPKGCEIGEYLTDRDIPHEEPTVLNPK